MWDFPGGSDGKESACNARELDSSLGQEVPLRRKWQPTLVFLPRGSHGLRNLLGYNLWDQKKLDITEWLTLSFHLLINFRDLEFYLIARYETINSKNSVFHILTTFYHYKSIWMFYSIIIIIYLFIKYFLYSYLCALGTTKMNLRPSVLGEFAKLRIWINYYQL